MKGGCHVVCLLFYGKSKDACENLEAEAVHNTPIYDPHFRQPNNRHLRLLYVCSLIYHEAGPVLRTHVSLTHDRQIEVFLRQTHPAQLRAILTADVVNDGRFVVQVLTSHHPFTRLHLALQKLESLKHLRVFEYRQRQSVARTQAMTLQLAFKTTLLPNAIPPNLTTYELHLRPAPAARFALSEQPYTPHMQNLRISLSSWKPESVSLPALRHLTLDNVIVNQFGPMTWRPLDYFFLDCQLESFTYLHNKPAFELNDRHIMSLAETSLGSQLRKLVLIGCDGLTTPTIRCCVALLDKLEYFALSLITNVTTEDLQPEFLYALPPQLRVLKIAVTNAQYSEPLLDQEAQLRDAFEQILLQRSHSPVALFISMRDELLVDSGVGKRWVDVAAERNISLQIGPWDKEEGV
ncbi:hypothetical protein EVG20_g1084 [Dentipellis fragilis]|uniref:F-box domain-containing protein n=1 Tax=Dentipellis fragilis TaxID=205917 RepID=A0A4Y9ZDH2_9AGAM|nr:hypothetical protein EVG20_g1084 [Dentipellis fragilis]